MDESPTQQQQRPEDHAHVSKQVRSGLKWTAIGRAAQRVLRFVSTMILARLLGPERLGLVAMATIIIESLVVFRELGFGPAYIQRVEESAEADRLIAEARSEVPGLAVDRAGLLILRILGHLVEHVFHLLEGLARGHHALRD